MFLKEGWSLGRVHFHGWKFEDEMFKKKWSEERGGLWAGFIFINGNVKMKCLRKGGLKRGVVIGQGSFSLMEI